MEIHFILVEPAVPENIGAAARAIKTMGFSSLKLIRPKDFPNERANWLAHASTEILDNARVYDNFEDAVWGLDMIIGSSAKKRSIKQDYYPVEEIIPIIKKKGDTVKQLGIVFGREESGLSNEEMDKCDMLAYIPMATSYPSLNLAQAVMLFAYILSPLSGKTKTDSSTAPGKIQGQNHSNTSFKAFKQRTEDILSHTEMDPNGPRYKRIMERLALLGEKDIKLLHSLSTEILKALRK